MATNGPVDKDEVADWAQRYGQPENPRRPDSDGGYSDPNWRHWNLQGNVAEVQEVHSQDEESGKENVPEVESPVRMRPNRKKSKSGSPSKERLPSVEVQKRWSRPPNPCEGDDGLYEKLAIFPVFLVLVMLLAGCAGLYYANENGYFATLMSSVKRPNHMPIFDKKLADLKLQFPSQPSHNWGILRSAFAEVLNNSNYEYGPAVLIVLASKKEQHLASCFAEKLANSLSKTFNPAEKPLYLSGSKLTSSHEPLAAKHTIDNMVRDKDNFVMYFTSLEQIDSYTASIFHSLCDYYNSPFKERAIFIFTVHTSEETEGRKRKEYDEMADKVLNNVWDELDINKRSALIARLTGSTILLKKEPRRVC